MPVELATEVGDPWRWVVLIIFSLYSASNAIQWVTFAPIATSAREYFNMTTAELNWLSTVYMIVFVIGAYFTCTTFEGWGVRWGVLIGCFLNTLGSVLKVAPGLLVPSYTTMIIPQSLNAISQLFVLSTPPLIAAQYFAPKQRAFSTSVSATANNLGNAIALFAPPLIVKHGYKSEFMLLFCLEMGFCSLTFLAAIFFLRSPRFKAPSKALLQQQATEEEPGVRNGEEIDLNADGNSLGGTHESQPFAEPLADDHKPVVVEGARDGTTAFTSHDGDREDPEASRAKKTLWRRILDSRQLHTFAEVAICLWELCKNRDFLFLLGAFSVGMGSVWTFASVLAQIFEPFGLSATLAGISGAVNVVVGVITAYMVGLWVDRYRRYKIPVIVSLCGSVVCIIALMVVMLKMPPFTTAFSGVTAFIYILAGAFQNTAAPIAFEFAMELTYPLAESVPAALLMAGANLCSLIMVSVASVMLGDGVAEEKACVHVVIMILCVCVAGTALSFFPRENLKRYKAEKYAKALAEEEANLGEIPHDDENGGVSAEPAAEDDLSNPYSREIADR